ncbi:MAG: hypothetical protein KAT86_07515 [Candidatus Latescibacteria bacterium]|nr:hypothetical protein [Candidatus Latescibacterota bacterium]
MKQELTSRERMLAALESRESDYVPCSFMIFTALLERCQDQLDFIGRQLELDLDAKVELPEFPIRLHPEVEVKEWKEKSVGHGYPLLHKQYNTPSGTLTAVVRKTEDWLYGDHVPLFDDYLVPRSEKFLVTSKEDLASVRFLFAEPTSEDIKEFRQKSAKLKEFASNKGLLVSAGWQTGMDPGCMGMDAVMWLCGMKEAVLLAVDQPEVIQELVRIIAEWNLKRMEIYLDEGVDLLIKRAWYEGTDLWSPSLYRKFMAPVVKKEIELTHQAGAKFGYIMTSGVIPLLDDLLNLGIDVLIGVDPLQGKGTDLGLLKQKLGGKICLWGGVNGFLTIENGGRGDVEQAVHEAIDILGPGGGLILSPVDNVRDTSQHTWDNVMTMINTWKKMRVYPIEV